MSRSRWLPAMLSAAALTVGGCEQGGGADSSRGQLAPDDRSPVALVESEHVLNGELRRVDGDLRTLTVLAGGTEYTFAYSDATTVSGASGAQGLAAQQGATVAVHYRELDGVRTAVRIELLGPS